MPEEYSYPIASKESVLDLPDSAENDSRHKDSGLDSSFDLIEYDSSPRFPRAKSPEKPVISENMDTMSETKHQSPSRQSSDASKSSSDSYVSADEHITVSRFVSETTFTVRNIRQELNKSESNPETHKPEKKVVYSYNPPSQHVNNNSKSAPEISKSGAIMEIENMVKDLEASHSDHADVPVRKVSSGSGKYTHSSQLKPQSPNGQNGNDPYELPKVSQLMKNFQQNSSSSFVSNGTTQPQRNSQVYLSKQSSRGQL